MQGDKKTDARRRFDGQEACLLAQAGLPWNAKGVFRRDSGTAERGVMTRGGYRGGDHDISPDRMAPSLSFSASPGPRWAAHMLRAMICAPLWHAPEA
eukprot:5875894-Pyramimonas_sp.AAC.1